MCVSSFMIMIWRFNYGQGQAYLQVENNVISPKIQANSLELPSLVILMAVTIGMYMFGLAGAIISIPVAGIVKVLIDEYPAIKALEQ